jgi:hypothetical protein
MAITKLVDGASDFVNKTARRAGLLRDALPAAATVTARD